MKPIMTSDIAQAIAIELEFLLPAGWSYVQFADHFVVQAPGGGKYSDAAFQLETERIAAFVAYAPKARPHLAGSGEMLLESKMSSGNGFTIRFLRAIT
jgi:hypothetical protein